MIRVAQLLAIGLLLAAAGPRPSTLPEPPVPPSKPPTDEAAPVPNLDAKAPSSVASEDPQIKLELYRLSRFDASQGFAPGSRYQSSEDRKPIQTPGVSIRVPLH